MVWIRFVTLIYALVLVSLCGAEEVDLAPVGLHQRLFRIYKNENPQNIMVVYTKVDKACNFVMEDHQPLIGFYWLMDGVRYKPVHSMIQNSIRKHARLTEVADREFNIAVKRADGFTDEIQKSQLTVRAQPTAKGCKVETLFPDQKGSGAFEVSYFRGESRKTFMPPFRRLVSVSVVGQGESGTAIERLFKMQ
jgi:hypothetical protein